jgi:PRTRC genetic system protein A
MIDKRDLALRAICPIVPMPKYSTLEPLTHNGERIVLASNGTFLEVRRSWARFIRKIGNVEAVVPFGELAESTTYFTQKMPRDLLTQFVEWARAESHVEIGANIVWNEVSNQFRLVRSRTLHGTGSHLEYEIPDLAVGEHIVIDCHSHSAHPAFFSDEDNRDDKDAVKLAFVVGNCDKAQQSIQMRLCVRGKYQKLPLQLKTT